MNTDLVITLAPFALGPLAFAAYVAGYRRGFHAARSEQGKIHIWHR